MIGFRGVLIISFFSILFNPVSSIEEIEIQEESLQSNIIQSLPSNANYKLSSSDHNFRIEGNILQTIKPLDRDLFQFDTIFLTLIPVDPLSPEESLTILLRIKDINDNPPIFKDPIINFNIIENQPAGVKIRLPEVTDADDVGNRVSTDYVLTTATENFELVITEDDVTLQTTRSLDREQQDFYQLRVRATDDGEPPLSGDVIVNVTILDINNNPPRFHQSDLEVFVWENATRGLKIAQLNATDADLGANGDVTYRLSPDDVMFEVDAHTGIVRLLGMLDFEIKSFHRVFVEASDCGVPVLSGSTSIKIVVGDVNDNNPQIHFRYFPSSASFASVDKNASVDDVIMLVTTTDRDVTSSVQLEVTSDDFRLQRVSASMSKLLVAREIWKRSGEIYRIEVTAIDWSSTGSRKSARIIDVIVNSPNRHPPQFEASVHRKCIEESLPTGSHVLTVHASDDDVGSSGTLRYRIVEETELFSIDAHSGVIVTSSARIISTNLTIEASDESRNPQLAFCDVIIDVININDQPPRFLHDDVIINAKETDEVLIEALDPDQLGPITYEIAMTRRVDDVTIAGGAGVFTIDAESGLFQILVPINISYDVTIDARDQGYPGPLTKSICVHVVTRDFRFYPSVYYITLPARNHSNVAQLRTLDGDDVVYFIDDVTSPLTVDRTSGRVSLTLDVINRKLEVKARSGGEIASAFIHFFTPEVEVMKFAYKRLKRATNSGNFTIPLRPSALKVDYVIEDGDPDLLFQLLSSDLHLQLFLKRESAKNFNLTILALARDGVEGHVIGVDAISVDVVIINSNRYKPRFLADDVIKLNNDPDDVTFTTSVDVNLNVTSSLLVFNATAVADDVIDYAVEDARGLFEVDSFGGLWMKKMKRQRSDLHQINIRARGRSFGRSINLQIHLCVFLNLHILLQPHFHFSILLAPHVAPNDVIFDLMTSLQLPFPVQIRRTRNDDVTVDIVLLENRNFGIFPDGKIYLKKKIERSEKLEVEMIFKDHFSSASSHVTLMIGKDVFEDQIFFSASSYNFSLYLPLPKDTFIGSILASSNFQLPIFYFICNSADDVTDAFKVDMETGELKTTRSNIQDQKINFQICASSSCSQRSGRSVQIFIQIFPVPFFDPIYHQIAINRDYVINKTIFHPIPKPSDVIIIRHQLHHITSLPFDVRSDGSIFISRELMTSPDHYRFQYEAFFATGISRQISFLINIITDDVIVTKNDVIKVPIVDDVIDYKPQFLAGSRCQLRAGDLKSFFVCSVVAVDRGRNITYDVIKARDDDAVKVEIEALSGRLHVTGNIRTNNYQPHGYLLVTVMATDQLSRATSFERVPIFIEDNKSREPLLMTSPTAIVWQRHLVVVDEVLYEMKINCDLEDLELVWIKDEKTSRFFEFDVSRAAVRLIEDLEEKLEDQLFRFRVLVRGDDEERVFIFAIIIMNASRRDSSKIDFYFNAKSLIIGSEIGVLEPEKSYFMTSSDDFIDHPFAISEQGVISVVAKLDYDVITSYTLTVVRYDVIIDSFDILKIEITTSDVNDHAPRISPSLSTYHLSEMSTAGHVVTRLSAYDVDGDSFTFELIELNANDFAINETSGIIRVATSQLDREVVDEYYFLVSVSDGRFTSKTSFTIVIEDVNDNDPIFQQKNFFFTISEDKDPLSVVGSIPASDADLNNNITYHIVAGNHDQIFFINQTSSFLFLNKKLDREEKDLHPLRIKAVDDGGLFSIVEVFINVKDVNDNHPQFKDQNLHLILSEDTPLHSVIMSLNATDEDLDLNGIIEYEIIAGNGSCYFHIDSISNELKLNNELQIGESLLINISATDQSARVSSRLTSYCVVTIDVISSGKNPPQLLIPDKWFISEDAEDGDQILKMVIFDVDSEDKDVDFEITSDLADELGKFVVNATTRFLEIQHPKIDREVIPEINLKIQIFEKRNANLSTMKMLKIIVDDVNDNPPKFEVKNLKLNLPESLQINDKITTIVARDADVGRNSLILFRVLPTSNQLVTIDSISGDVFVTSLKYTQSVCNVTIEAFDCGVDSLSNQMNITLIFNHLHLKTSLSVNLEVEENQKNIQLKQFEVSDLLVESFSVRIVSVIPTQGADLKKSSLFSSFTMNPDGRLVLLKELDREICSGIRLEVLASSRGTSYSFAFIYLKVIDQNEFLPKFQLPFYKLKIPESLEVGSVILNVSSSDKDAGIKGINNFFLNSSHPFIIDKISGSIYLSEELDREEKDSYIFQIFASDGDHITSADVIIEVDDVNDNPAVFSQSKYLFHISSLQHPGEICGLVSAFDPDLQSDVNFWLKEELKSFQVDPKTGLIIQKLPLKTQLYSFEVFLNEGSLKQQKAFVEILASNQTGPNFNNWKDVKIEIEENSLEPKEVFNFKTDLNDVITTKNFTFHLKTENRKFEIQSSGRLCLKDALDCEEEENILLIIEIRSQISFFISIHIQVLDVNDVIPQPTRHLFHAHVIEGELSDVIIINTTDADIKNEIEFFLTGSDSFEIDRKSGVIRNRKLLDREEQANFLLRVDIVDVPGSTSCFVDVVVDDVDDNPPVFTKLFAATVREDANIGDDVIQVTSVDADVDARNFYHLVDDKKGTFSINSQNGLIKLMKKLDFENVQNYELKVEVSGSGWNAATSVFVTIENINDNPPTFKSSEIKTEKFQTRFENDEIEVQVRNGTIGHVTTLHATDLDDDKIYFKILDTKNRFSIDPKSGLLSSKFRLFSNPMTSQPLTRHNISILASDRGFPFSMTSQANVIIKVLPDNRHSPRIVEPRDVIIAIDQSTGVNSTVMRVVAEDEDPFQCVHYQLNGHERYFRIDDVIGDIITTADMSVVPLGTQFRVQVVAVDDGLPQKWAKFDFMFEVATSNKYRPKFQQQIINVRPIREDLAIGSKVATIYAKDRDVGVNGVISYSILSEDSSFDINSITGEVFICKKLNYNHQSHHELLVQAKDSAIKPFYENATIVIPIIDVDDHKPVFNSSYFHIYIKEDMKCETSVARIVAYDEDSYELSVVFYSIQQTGLFAITTLTANLYLKKGQSLDYERQNLYKIQIFASNSQEQEVSSAYLIIHILDVNEYIPQFLTNQSDFFISNDNNKKKSIERISCVDEDQGHYGRVNYYILSTTDFFQIDSSDLELKSNSNVSIGDVFEVTIIIKNPNIISSVNQTDIKRIKINIVSVVCLENPCQNKGICEEGIKGRYQCICPQGFTGKKCDEEIDECFSDPCQNQATCLDEIGNFSCLCVAGFTGRFCQNVIDHCSTQPCLNGGTCENSFSNYSCKCGFGNLGENCEIESFGFNWNSFVEVESFHKVSNSIYLEFATVSSSALLIYNFGGKSEKFFFALQILRGRLYLSYKGLTLRTSSLVLGENLFDGSWHSVSLIFSKDQIILKIDDCNKSNKHHFNCFIQKKDNFQFLLEKLSTSRTFIGGVRSVEDLLENPRQISAYQFVGCLRRFIFNSASLFLASADDVIDFRDVTEGCQRASNKSEQCARCSGTCVDEWTKIGCKCETLPGEEKCKPAEIGRFFGGNSKVLLKYSSKYRRRYLVENSGALKKQKKFQKKNSFFIELQTNCENCQLLQITSNHSTTLSIQIKKGTFSVNFRQIHDSIFEWSFTKVINNGKRHQIAIDIDTNDVTSSVDGSHDSTFPSSLRYNDLLNAANIKEIILGGFEDPSFRGCLYLVSLNEELLPLIKEDLNDVFEIVKSDVDSKCSCNPCKDHFRCEKKINSCICSSCDDVTCIENSCGCEKKICKRKNPVASWLIAVIISLVTIATAFLIFFLFRIRSNRRDSTKEIAMTDLKEVDKREDDDVTAQKLPDLLTAADLSQPEVDDDDVISDTFQKQISMTVDQSCASLRHKSADLDSSYGSEYNMKQDPLHPDPPRHDLSHLDTSRKRLNPSEIASLQTSNGYDVIMPRIRRKSESSLEDDDVSSSKDLAEKFDFLNPYGKYFQEISGLFKDLSSIPSKPASKPHPDPAPISASTSLRCISAGNYGTSKSRRHGRQSAPLTSSKHRKQPEVELGNKLEHYV